MANFVNPEELTYYIDSIRSFQLVDIGSSKWLDVHEMIIKLSQQAILEASEHREEEVKEFLIARDKLKVLIHEAYSIFLWKTRVLPHLLEIDPNPQATFLIYTVLFHEGAVISLLDTALFHVSACETLQEAAIDLVDYCSVAVSQVIGLVSMGYHENDSKLDMEEAVLSELEGQKRDLIFKIGMRCVSILCYLAEHADSIPLSASRRMLVAHDVPWLMADFLQFKPWQRRKNRGLERFIDEKWSPIKGDEIAKVTKQEAQSWFCMRQLLFNQSLMVSYDLNEERRKHLAKCQGLLHETILDQLPPLVELKQYLCHLSVTGSANESKKSKLVLEELPEIREKLIAESERIGGFLVVAQKQEDIFLSTDKDKIFQMAKRLNAAYNTDLLVELEEKTSEKVSSSNDFITNHQDCNSNGQKCEKCAANAVKKCANCKIKYYCSRQCQVEDWPKHKHSCNKL